MRCLASGFSPLWSPCLHTFPLSLFVCCFQLQCHLLYEVLSHLYEISPPSTPACPKNYHTILGLPVPSQQKLKHAQTSTFHPTHVLSMKLLEVTDCVCASLEPLPGVCLILRSEAGKNLPFFRCPLTFPLTLRRGFVSFSGF